MEIKKTVDYNPHTGQYTMWVLDEGEQLVRIVNGQDISQLIEMNKIKREMSQVTNQDVTGIGENFCCIDLITLEKLKADGTFYNKPKLYRWLEANPWYKTTNKRLI